MALEQPQEPVAVVQLQRDRLHLVLQLGQPREGLGGAGQGGLHLGAQVAPDVRGVPARDHEVGAFEGEVVAHEDLAATGDARGHALVVAVPAAHAERHGVVTLGVQPRRGARGGQLPQGEQVLAVPAQTKLPVHDLGGGHVLPDGVLDQVHEVAVADRHVGLGALGEGNLPDVGFGGDLAAAVEHHHRVVLRRPRSARRRWGEHRGHLSPVSNVKRHSHSFFRADGATTPSRPRRGAGTPPLRSLPCGRATPHLATSPRPP